MVVVDVKKNKKNKGGSNRCKKHLKTMVVVVEVKIILKQWW
jgi:hypothetical protein